MGNGTIYNFQVTHKLRYQILDSINESVSNFDLQVVQIHPISSRLKLNRDNFTVNGKDITSKFEQLTHQYHETFFPIIFDFSNNQFNLINYNEIKERLTLKDIDIRKNYAGSGLDHIRSSLLNVAASRQSLTSYFYSMGLLKVLLFNLDSKQANSNFIFKWRTIPFKCNLNHESKRELNPESNSISFNATGTETSDTLTCIKNYLLRYGHKDAELTDESLATSIQHQTTYITEHLDFQESKTNINLSNANFDYNESFELKRIYDLF